MKPTKHNPVARAAKAKRPSVVPSKKYEGPLVEEYDYISYWSEPEQEVWENEGGKMLLIDPPSGWKYGFPKPYDNPDNKPLEEWLLENGYPQKEIDNSGAKYCRFLSGEVEELEQLEEDTGLLPAFKRGIKIT